MNATLKSFRTLTALALAATLAACGGGGGGGSDDTGGTNPPDGGTNPPADVVAAAGTLKTVAGVATYTPASLEASAFDALNEARGSAGAGVVSQSAALDTSAAAHAKYLTTNITGGLVHTEDSAKDDYYEATLGSRLTKAGFSASYSTEVIGGTGASLKGSDCILGLMNTVYHGAALLSQSTNVGIGFGTDAAGIPLCVADLGATATETYTQVAPAGQVIAYPYSGQAGVLETFYVAYESPRPSATLFPNTTAGTPVLVSLRNADFINAKAAGTLAATVTKFELKNAAGASVPAGILAAAGITGTGVTLNADTNLAEGYVVLVPLEPLDKGATYSASFTATVKSGGAAVTKVWDFTTNP